MGNSLITAKGSQAAESANKSGIDLEKVMIRLKDGESVKVRLLSADDYVEYQAVSGFNLGVYTQPSVEPLGRKDYFVEASKLANAGKVDEKFKVLYPKKRYLIAMADVITKELRVWDASKTQFTSFLSDLKEYEDIITDGEELVFTFKRTGNKTETKYTLSPVLRAKAEETEGFKHFDGQTVPDELFENCLVPRTEKMQVQILKDAGFPVEQYFPEIDLSNEETTETATEETEENPLDSI